MDEQLVRLEAKELYATLRLLESIEKEPRPGVAEAILERCAERKEHWIQASLCGESTCGNLANAWLELELSADLVVHPAPDFANDWDEVFNELRYEVPAVQLVRLVEQGLDEEEASVMQSLMPDDSANSIYNSENMAMAKMFVDLALYQRELASLRLASTAIAPSANLFVLAA